MPAITKYVLVTPMESHGLYEQGRYDTLEDALDEAERLTTPDKYSTDPDEATVHIYRVTQELVGTRVAEFQADATLEAEVLAG